MIFIKKVQIFYVIRVISAIGLLLVILIYLINSNIYFDSGIDENIMVGIIFGAMLYQTVTLLFSNTSIHALNGMI